MEILFIIISLLMVVVFILTIVMFVHGSWSQTRRAIKRYFSDDGGFLGILLIFLGIMLTMIFFITLCAFNNSFWHIDYMFAEGQWK